MKRIAVLGNCQSTYVAHCARYLARGSEVDSFVLFETNSASAEVAGLAERLSSYDHVFAQTQFVSGFAGTVLDGDANRVVRFPSIEFTAFHPDLVYIRVNGGNSPNLASPIGEYHSALAFLCYSLGLSVDETVSRFNESVFERLGYFSPLLWTSSEQNLFRSGKLAGIPVERYYRSWVRRGCFMYSVNHPKLFVLANIAAAMLNTRGFQADARLCEDYVMDETNLGPVWPVYPEIATKMGIPGSYIYKGVTWAGQPSPYFDLAQFVQGSFDRYEQCDLDQAHCPRVVAWEANAGLVQDILGGRAPIRRSQTSAKLALLPDGDGASLSLPQRSDRGDCMLDWINQTAVPLAPQLVVPAGEDLLFLGWALDSQNFSLAGGVDLVIDGIPFRAAYGESRKDVAEANRNEAYTDSGFRFTLRAEELCKGAHSYGIRVINKDGSAYDEGSFGTFHVV